MRIIVSADDFGRSSDRNRAIDFAMRAGIIKSTALLMGSDYTEEAVELAFRGGYIDKVHCHLNLHNGISLGNHFVPSSNDFKKNPHLSLEGEFRDVNYNNPLYFKYFNDLYSELECQLVGFKSITRNSANNNHVDFHLYKNQTLLASYAYNKLIKSNQIKTARYFGEQQMINLKGKIKVLLSMIGMTPFRIQHIRSCNIDWFINMFDTINCDLIELYCHPDYCQGELIDNTISVFGHEKMPLEVHLGMIQKRDNVSLISWAEL